MHWGKCFNWVFLIAVGMSAQTTIRVMPTSPGTTQLRANQVYWYSEIARSAFPGTHLNVSQLRDYGLTQIAPDTLYLFRDEDRRPGINIGVYIRVKPTANGLLGFLPGQTPNFYLAKSVSQSVQNTWVWPFAAVTQNPDVDVVYNLVEITSTSGGWAIIDGWHSGVVVTYTITNGRFSRQ